MSAAVRPLGGRSRPVRRRQSRDEGALSGEKFSGSAESRHSCSLQQMQLFDGFAGDMNARRGCAVVMIKGLITGGDS